MIFVLAPLASAAPILSTLTVHQPDAEKPYTHDLSMPDLWLGESLPSAEITVDCDTDRSDAVFVEMQFETSLAVSRDGPHWQLDDFARHASPWRPAWTTDGLTLPPYRERPPKVPHRHRLSAMPSQHTGRDSPTAAARPPSTRPPATRRGLPPASSASRRCGCG